MEIRDNLTLFSDREYVELSIAGFMGMDKEEWKTRLEWVRDNDRYLDTLMQSADEPYQYRKAVHALRDLDAGKPIGYACGMDSTASGVQMFACLSGCKDTARAVNLIGDGIRHDLYTDVGKELNLDIIRKQLKDAIMTYFYFSIATPEKVFGDDVHRFYQAMETMLPGAFHVTELLRKCQTHTQGEPYRFNSMDGSEVLIRPKIVVEKKIECKLEYNTSLPNFYFNQQMKVFGNKPNDKSLGAAVAHDCDAWLSRMATMGGHDYGFEVYHVHDKFFCSPKYMNRLRWIIRNHLCELADSDHLTQVVRKITGISNYKYPKKSQNLSDLIAKSDYFIN